MSYRQLVTPNLDPVIHQPNNIGGTYIVMDWYGWCLAYVQYAFAVGWAGDPASDAWNNRLSQKHQDRDLPSDVYVPIWFSGYGGQGHAAIYKDGQVWSSPWHHKATYDVMSSIAETERIYGVTYIGWSEDLAGRQLIEQVADPSPIPPQPTYQVTETYPDGKQIQLNKQPTNLWGMNYIDPGSLTPIEVHNQGEIFTDVSNKVHHQNGYDYYRRDDQVDGFNVLDCNDYTPPTPSPYIPPAAPAEAKMAIKYKLATTLKYYGTLEDAQADKNAVGSLSPRADDYYVFDSVGIFKNLSTDNQIDQNKWVNILDNVLSPEPIKVTPPKVVPVRLLPSQVKPGTQADSTWKSSYKSFYPDRHSDLYEVKQHLTMLDYSGKKNPVAVQPGDKMNVTGTFVKDGVMFYRTRSGRDELFTWYYGISLYDDQGNIQIVKVVETDPTKIERRISDYLHYWKDDIKDIMDIFILRKKKK